VVLVALSTSKSSFLVEAISPDCTLDTHFGHEGILDLALPGKNDVSSIDVMVPLRSGNVLLVGSVTAKMIAAEVTPLGRLVRTFGHSGWLVHALPGWSPGLDWGPSIDSVVQASSGDILVASDNGSSHVSTQGDVYEFTPGGGLDGSFGRGGWRRVLPIGAYIDQLIAEPNGSIVVYGQGVFGGCGGPEFEVLKANGQRDWSVNSNLARTESTVRHAGLKNGVVYLDHQGGMGLVGFGFGLKGCYSSGQFGYTEQLTPKGRVANGTHRTYFKSGSFDIQFGVSISGNRFVSAGENWDQTVLGIREFQQNGAPVSAFGRGGIRDIRLGSWIYASGPLVFAGPNGDVDVIVDSPRGARLLEVTT